MDDLTNLSPDISPDAFFALVAKTLANEAAPDNARPEKAQITLRGDGGGTWVSGFEDGRLVIAAGSADTPPVHLTLTVDHWRAFVAGAVRDAVKEHADVTAINPKALNKLYQSADKIDQVMGLKGTLQAVVTDGDTHYTAHITTGGIPVDLDNPTAKISVALADFVQLASGQENPQMAFFAGKIQVEGDMNHVMGLMALSLS